MVLKWLKKKLAQNKIELNLPNDIDSSRPPSSDGQKRQVGIPKEGKGQGGQAVHKAKRLKKQIIQTI